MDTHRQDGYRPFTLYVKIIINIYYSVQVLLRENV